MTADLGVAGLITAMVIDDVKHAAANAPRSRQRAVGPSELGTPCTRRLAYRIGGQDAVNTDTDPWAASIGTDVHAGMAEKYAAKNKAQRDEWLRYGLPGAQPAPRYLIEHRVSIPVELHSIGGSADLLDRELHTVIDWKMTSPKRIAEYRRKGPGEQYRTQAHIYGLGFQLAGERVDHVADVFLPRGGRITDLYVWSEPFDPTIAVAAIERYKAVRGTVIALDPEAHPETWALLPSADAYCTFCPFYLPYSSDLGRGCPGHSTVPPAESLVDSMIAPRAS